MADGAAPGGGGHRPEDELDRALRALTEGTAGEARFKELSAAERAEAGAEAAKAARRRAEERARAAKAAQKQAGRQGGGPAPAEPPRAGGGRVRVAVAVIAAFALAGIGLFTLQRLSHPVAGGGAGLRLATGSRVPTQAAVSLPSPSPVAAPGPPADPFAGTKAEFWANGSAGITIPVARPATFTAAQVAAAYATTRQLLIAQNLDRTTLLGGPPTAFAALLTVKERKTFLTGLSKTGRAKDGSDLSTRGWVASFAPGTTSLIGNVIRVHGTMTARAATGHGSEFLAIDVNYRFVYPVNPPRAPAQWIRVVGQVSGYVQFDNWADPGGPLQPWVATAFPAEAGTRCDMPDGYRHPQYPGGPPDKVQPSGPPRDPYSMASPDTAGDSAACRSVTRT